MVNLKRGLIYISFVIIYFEILYWGLNVHEHIRDSANLTYSIGLLLTYSSIFPILYGILLAIPSFVSRIFKPGIFQLDWVKLLAVGIPTLFIANWPILYFFTPIERFLPLSFLLTGKLTSQIFFTSGLCFGYILLGSIHKKELS